MAAGKIQGWVCCVMLQSSLCFRCCEDNFTEYNRQQQSSQLNNKAAVNSDDTLHLNEVMYVWCVICVPHLLPVELKT